MSSVENGSPYTNRIHPVIDHQQFLSSDSEAVIDLVPPVGKIEKTPANSQNNLSYISSYRNDNVHGGQTQHKIPRGTNSSKARTLGNVIQMILYRTRAQINKSSEAM